jgi:uncharacterized protein (UPF0548 family)
MPTQLSLRRRARSAAGWPLGVALTSWRYMWRTTPIDRWELTGSPADDSPPPVPAGVRTDDLQRPGDGAGPLMHRLYRVRIHGSSTSPERLIARLASDLDAMAPREVASFHRLRGAPPRLAVNDEYVVRMPGPWDGPVQVVAVTDTSFRLATLTGHLEAGQIEFRARHAGRELEMAIESWARSGDRLSDLLYSRARMAKEIQLYMWTAVLMRIVQIAGGRRDGPIVVTTRRVDDVDRAGGTGPGHRAARRALARLASARLNFDTAALGEGSGWHRDDMIEPLPREAPGPPVEDGAWSIARRLMLEYQMADPARVRATYRPGAPLEGRDMLLTIRFAGLRLREGVRVGEVYEESRTVDGREARVFGWSYATLEGHFEEGRMHYEIWKWIDTGEVHFRLHATSRLARSGPLWRRIGFRLLGRSQQLEFYRRTCRRMRRLTESQLELAEVGR